MRRIHEWALVVALLVPAVARGNGAFPDSSQILVPADRPDEIILGTNFGLVITRDGARTWRWICEQAIAPAAYQYNLGAPPDDRLLALSPAGLYLSRDRGCTFQQAGGAIAARPGDAFPDPLDPAHVLALAGEAGGAGATRLYESRDGGRTFGDPLYTAPAGFLLTGVEIARSDPRTVYLTMVENLTIHPYLLRSTDGARSFVQLDALPAVGKGTLLIGAVDPDDPRKVFFRARTVTGDKLALTEDSGATIVPILTSSTGFTALLRVSGNGGLDVIVGSLDGGFLSHDGGHRFTEWRGAPHVRALGERAGKVYVAADDLNDRYAVAVSENAGRTWTPIFRLEQITGLLAGCDPPHRICARAWQSLAGTLGLTSTVTPDAGPVDAVISVPPRSGCGCRAEERSGSGAPWCLVALLWAGRRRR